MEVERPDRGTPRASVALGDRCEPGEPLADHVHPSARHIEGHHRIRAVAELAVAHPHPHALDHALAPQPPEPFHDVCLGQSGPIRHRRVGSRGERQPVADGLHEATVGRIEQRAPYGRVPFRRCRTTPGRRPALQGKSGVDVVIALHAQVEHLEAGAPANVGDGLVERSRIRRREHEPEVELVLAFVDFADGLMAAHPFGHRIEPRPGDRHRRQGARIDASRREHRADPAHHAPPHEPCETLEHFARAAMEAARHRCIRHFALGEVVLVRLEQLPIQPLEDRRNARPRHPERGTQARRNGPRTTRAQPRPVRRMQLCNSFSALDHVDSLRRSPHWGRSRVRGPAPRATCIPSTASMSTTPRAAGSCPMVCSHRHLQREAPPGPATTGASRLG